VDPQASVRGKQTSCREAWAETNELYGADKVLGVRENQEHIVDDTTDLQVVTQFRSVPLSSWLVMIEIGDACSDLECDISEQLLHINDVSAPQVCDSNEQQRDDSEEDYFKDTMHECKTCCWNQNLIC